MSDNPQASLAPAAAEFTAKVEALSHANIHRCLQCAKCTSGCPVAARGDLKSHELLRLVQWGMEDEVRACKSIWQCVSCQTCTTRCPQGVDIAAMIDALRRLSRLAGKSDSGTTVPVFNDIFLNTVRKRGRIYEMGLMTAYKLRTLDLFSDVSKFPLMLRKGKLPLLGPQIKGRGQRKQMFARAKAARGDRA